LTTVSVKFLGCGDNFGSGGRFQTCIYVQSEAAKFFIDCGASSLIAMKQFGVSLLDIETILITHLHGDHFACIPFFILDSQLISRRTSPLIIAGLPCLEERIYRAMEVMFPESSKVKQKFEIIYLEIPERMPTTIGALLVTAEQVVHSSGAPSMESKFKYFASSFPILKAKVVISEMTGFDSVKFAADSVVHHRFLLN